MVAFQPKLTSELKARERVESHVLNTDCVLERRKLSTTSSYLFPRLNYLHYQVVIATTSSIVYNLYLSPLSKIPGPAICAVSRLPYLWYNWKGKLVHWVHDLHLTYGDVVRIAPDELTFINPEAHKDIYGFGSRNLRDRRFYGETPKGVQDILRSDDKNHARFRRVLNHSLSERVIQEKQPMIHWHVDNLVEKIRSSLTSSPSGATPTHEFDVTRLYDLTTFDIMAELCFGEPLHVHESDEFHGWMDSMFTMVHRAAVFRTALYFRWTLIFLPVVMVVLGPLMKKQESYFKKCQERVDRRMESKLPRKDMWTHIIDLPKELQLTRSEMHFNSQILMVGGTETTATLLAGMTYYLLQSPQIMEKLVAEIHHAFKSESEITLSALAKLEYLNACIQEGLRIFPPAPMGMARITPPEGNVICGHQIPGNVRIPSPCSLPYSLTNLTYLSPRLESPSTAEPSHGVPSISKPPTNTSPSAGSKTPSTPRTTAQHCSHSHMDRGVALDRRMPPSPLSHPFQPSSLLPSLSIGDNLIISQN